MSLVMNRNNVHIRGTGNRAMLFVQGWGCDQQLWQLTAPSFVHDFITIQFDHVGSGRSQLPAYSTRKYSTLEAYARDIVEIGQELELQHAVIIGHSSGAMIAALASIIAPKMFDQLILIAASARLVDDRDCIGGFTESEATDIVGLIDHDYLAWSSRMAPLLMGNPKRPELSRDLRQLFSRSEPSTASEFARVAFQADERSRMGEVTARTLLLQTSEDVLAPTTAVSYIHQHLPSSELVRMDAKGHYPQLCAPAQTISAIHRFVREAQPLNGFARDRMRLKVAESVRRGTEFLDAPLLALRKTPEHDADRHEVEDALIHRKGELAMHLGRFDRYALTLQEMLLSIVPSVPQGHYTVRTRGVSIANLLAQAAPESLTYFLETKTSLEAVLDRHDISARSGAVIAGVKWPLRNTPLGRARTKRDWFDHHSASISDLLAEMAIVERDLLKVVALCFRIAHSALDVQRVHRRTLESRAETFCPPPPPEGPSGR